MHIALTPLILPLLARWRRRLASARRTRAELAALMALGQHELNDLGIGRSELGYVLRAQASENGCGATDGTGPIGRR